MSSERRRTRYTAEIYKKIVNYMKSHKLKYFSDAANKYIEHIEKQLEELKTQYSSLILDH